MGGKLKTVQKEKFGQEEERVRLRGKVHVLTAESDKLDQTVELMKKETATKVEELQKFQIISDNLSEEKYEQNSAISELEGQVRCEEEELAKARQRCSDLEVLTEKTKVELDALVDSLSSADQNINENNVEKEKMLNNLAVEEIDLNNLEADNLMLQAEE